MLARRCRRSQHHLRHIGSCRGAICGTTPQIEAVVVSDTAVTVTLLLAALGGAGTGTLVIPATIGKARARLSLVVPGQATSAPDPALVAVVAQARDWFGRLASGAACTVRELADADGVGATYVGQLIGAAFLAPDLVTAIVEGRQPRGLSAGTLRAMLPLPASWAEQRALFARLG